MTTRKLEGKFHIGYVYVFQSDMVERGCETLWTSAIQMKDGSKGRQRTLEAHTDRKLRHRNSGT